MNLEQQVSNKELSLRMRELGVKQESLFYWRSNALSGGRRGEPYYVADNVVGYTDYFAAFTVAELGEMLWNAFDENGWDLLWKAYGESFDFKGTQRIGELGIINLMRRPDMAAKMLIYLIENKLITV